MSHSERYRVVEFHDDEGQIGHMVLDAQGQVIAQYFHGDDYDPSALLGHGPGRRPARRSRDESIEAVRPVKVAEKPLPPWMIFVIVLALILGVVGVAIGLGHLLRPGA